MLKICFTKLSVVLADGIIVTDAQSGKKFELKTNEIDIGKGRKIQVTVRARLSDLKNM